MHKPPLPRCIHYPNTQFNLGAINDTQEQRHISPSHPIQILNGTPTPEPIHKDPERKTPLSRRN